MQWKEVRRGAEGLAFAAGWKARHLILRPSPSIPGPEPKDLGGPGRVATGYAEASDLG